MYIIYLYFTDTAPLTLTRTRKSSAESIVREAKRLAHTASITVMAPNGAIIVDYEKEQSIYV